MFEYLDNVFGAIKISNVDGFLSLVSLQQDTRQLRSVGDYLYSTNDRTTTSHLLYRGKQGEYLVSDGFRTYEKVPTAYLLAHWTSILLGLAGMVWILVSGSITTLRYRSEVFRRPEAPAFVGTALLFAPLPFFLAQPFMALGDFTIASALLAIVTFLLPIGMLSTIMLVTKTWRESRINLLHGLAAAFVLQWCAVLAAAGMLPLRLWV